MSGSNGRDVEAIRRFNRFYRRLIGLLDEGYLESAYSLKRTVSACRRLR